MATGQRIIQGVSNMTQENTGDKKIWRRDEISLADWLMSFKNDLTKEFLACHDDFLVGDFKKGIVINNAYNPATAVASRADAWKVDPLIYIDPFNDNNIKLTLDTMSYERKQIFPTAVKILQELGEDCPIACYSILEANSIINRHTGPENRNADYIRVHVPLIVPPGDIFFEVAGEEVDWSDLFGFDNQRTHSAYNYTPRRRLVFLIDISRKRLGILPGRSWSKAQEDAEAAIPFERKKQ